tara:strand:+ start:157 stop:594 length:438 start_codon:yes stop_codon:yes gene_type:complete
MEDYNEILETEETQPTGVPDAVKVLAIISYIGHGFLIIIFLISMAFFATASGSNVARIMGSQVDGFMTILIVVFLLFISFSVISIIGAAKMHKGKKIGFVLFAIGSGLLGLLFLLGAAQQMSNLILGLITLGLVVGFATQLKQLR